MRADAFGMPVVSMKTPEAASLGAAILGGIGSGCFHSFQEAVERMVKTDQAYEPEAERSREYQRRFQEYVEIYPALKHWNDRISQESVSVG
jgi:sugar (pentulose or hexulose) kinase